MSDKTTQALSTEDEALWLRAVEGIKPIDTERHEVKLSRPPSTRVAHVNHAGRQQADDIGYRGGYRGGKEDERGALSLHERAASGLSRHEQRDLRNGQVAIDRRLDLHKLTCEQARVRVHASVRQGYQTGARLLHVITGKGQGENSGVLKRSLLGWLNEKDIRHMVVLVTHAARQHGGDGAFYVRLKRNRLIEEGGEKNGER